MPWQPLPRIVFAIAVHPFQATSPADLPLELGDELYIIEEGGRDGQWLRGYLVAPPSLLAGLSGTQGQTLEARVFSGIFPRNCVDVREVLGDHDDVSVTYSQPESHMLTNGDALHRRSVSSMKTLERTVRSNKDNIKRITNSPENMIRKRKQSRRFSPLSKPVPRDLRQPKPQAPVPMLKIGDESPTSLSEPLVDEISSCLREWHSTNLHQLLLTRQYALLDSMSNLIKQLDNARRQLLHHVLTSHELEQLRRKTVWTLVKGNKLLNGGVMVRDPMQLGRILVNEDSAVKVSKLQSVMSLLDDDSEVTSENPALRHLLLDIKSFASTSTEPTSLAFRLVTSNSDRITDFSETYIVEAPSSSSFPGLTRSSRKTLFTELGLEDHVHVTSSKTEMYLVVTVVQVQTVQPSHNHSTPSPRYDTVARSDIRSISTVPERSRISTTSKSTRRSMMWGRSGQSSRNKQPPVLIDAQSMNQADDRQSRDGRISRDGRPSTVGSVTTNGGTESRETRVPRTVGVGAIKLDDGMEADSEIERTIDIWVPSSKPLADELKTEHNGDNYLDIIKHIMPSEWGQFDKSRTAERLQISLLPFTSSDARERIRSTPTLLSDASLTKRMGFEGAPVEMRSDIYVTLDDVLLPKLALLSRWTGAGVPIPTSFAGENLQITMELRRESGQRIENAIYCSSSDEIGVSSWESTAISRSSAWRQTLRLQISVEDVQTAHLVIVLTDVPNQAFAICHLPLWEQHAFLKDGHHSLLLYRYDDLTSIPLPNATGRGGYLSLPWGHHSKVDGVVEEPVNKLLATLRLQTYLCSTQLSQDMVLVSLLKWRSCAAGNIPGLLRQLIFVPEIEIVKLLPDVLDALFGILVEHAGHDELEDLVFGCIVTVLGIVHDRRFNLIPLVDAYTEDRFDFPFATPCLVRSLARLLADPSHPETSRNLRATFKVTKHILKFINRARQQQKVKEAGVGITSTSPGFSRSVCSVFSALEELMKNTMCSLVGSQTLAVQHFHTWLPELVDILTPEDTLQVALNFMESCSEVKGKLILYKLILIVNFTKLDIFLNLKNRSILASHTVRWIEPYWGKKSTANALNRDQIRLCCSVVASQADMLGRTVPQHVPNIVSSYLMIRAKPKKDNTRLSLLFPTTYPFPSRTTDTSQVYDESLIELAALMSTLSVLPQGLQLDSASCDMATILSDMMYMQLSVLEKEAFPADWLSVHLYHHRSILRILKYIAGILMDSFLPSPEEAMNYDTDLWKIFFTVLLRLVGSDALTLETFAEQRRRAAWKIAGDIREEGAELLRDTWDAIAWDASSAEQERYGVSRMGGFQVQFVPGLVGSIVELCLSVHEGLRRVAVEVLHAMIISEWAMYDDLGAIQTEMIDSLDLLFKDKMPSDSTLRKLFIKELMLMFRPLNTRPQEPLSQALKVFVGIIDEFVDLLVAVHSKELAGGISHLVHRLRLMNFLRGMQKEEILIRYSHQLADLQIGTGNFTEAGLSLLLHADLYNWDPNTSLPALQDPVFPPQTHFERKERLYFETIKYFEDGEAWSSALHAYKTLEKQYEENVFDFAKLARTQRAIASIYETIAQGEKTTLRYFKVSYRGMGFPAHMRDKEFIFEGLPHEKTAAFTDRMQAQHPNAKIAPTSNVEDMEGQYLQISTLNTHRDLEHVAYQRSRVPQYVREYLAAASPQYFAATIKRNIAGPVEEHWAEKMVYKTESAFPTILRRAEIIDVQCIRLTPLQTALERVLRKTHEMAIVEKRVQTGEDDHVPLLIDALNISVSASADSSIVRYRDLLPSKRQTMEDAGSDELSRLQHEDFSMSPLENALKMALIDHAVMIKRCLAMFSNSTNSQARHSHDDLSQNFEANFGPELSVLSTPRPEVTLTVSPLRIDHSYNVSTPLSQGRKVPPSMTSGTIATVSTSMLDTPSHRPAPRSSRLTRLSFLSVTRRMRNESDPHSPPPGPPISYKSNGIPKKQTNGRRSSLEPVTTNTTHTTYDSHKPNIESRRSFFGVIGGNHGKSQNPTLENLPLQTQYPVQQENTVTDNDENDWVTDMGSEMGVRNATSRMYSNNNGRSRAGSSASVTTTQSFSTNGVGSGAVSKGGGGNNVSGAGTGEGVIRKRLSLFRLGGDRKGSKVSVMAGGSLVEE